MRITQCQEVWIHFRASHLSGQHITSSEITGASHLCVSREGDELTVVYVWQGKDPIKGNLTNKPLKIITYNFADIREYTCENNVTVARE